MNMVIITDEMREYAMSIAIPEEIAEWEAFIIRCKLHEVKARQWAESQINECFSRYWKTAYELGLGWRTNGT